MVVEEPVVIDGHIWVRVPLDMPCISPQMFMQILLYIHHCNPAYYIKTSV